jgi:hypothetical protein
MVILLIARRIFAFFCAFFLFSGLVEAAGEYAFIARGTVLKIVSRGNASDYKLKQADGNTVLLKSPGMTLEKGEDVAFFVRLGAKEDGLTTYLPIKFSISAQPFPFTDGISRIKVTDDAVMMFNKQGRSVGKLYADISPFHEGVASVRAKEYNFTCGFVDTEGNMVIEPYLQYMLNDYYYFRNGFAAISTGKYGYIDKKGKLTIYSKNNEWWPISPFSEGFAFIKYISGVRNGNVHLIDEKGVIQSKEPLTNNRLWIPCQPFSNGLAALQKNGLWGFIDHSGAFVIEPEYENVRPFSEGYAAVQTLDKQSGYIDTKGNWVVNASYEQAYPFSDGLAPVRLEDSWGYVNASGEVVIKAIYAKAGHFSEGVAPAAFPEKFSQEKWGLIDKKGNWVVEPRYDNAYMQKEELLFNIPGFSDDLLLVSEYVGSEQSRGVRYVWIDRSGKETLILFMPINSLW